MNLAQNDIPLSEAVSRILRNKRRVTIFLVVGIAVGTVVALTARPVFESETVMLVQSQSSENGAGGIAKRLSGLASAAGITLGSSQDSDARDAAIATLSSYRTLSTFISAEGIEKAVLEEPWRRNPLASLGAIRRHTMWEAVREFRDHMIVGPEKDSSLVRLSIEWYDPESASRWTNDLVALADARLRAQALDIARGRIAYLQKELERNPVLSVREVISGMMENELRTMATAGADKEFTFRIIDPAIPAERRARPHRLLIVTAFAFCGLLLGSIIAVLFDRSRIAEYKNNDSALK